MKLAATDIQTLRNLRTARQARGLSLKQVKSCSPSTLCAIERGHRNPSFSLVSAIAREIGLTVEIR